MAVLTIVTWGMAAQGTCIGDCNGDSEVTVDEIVRGVGIALGANSIELCRSLDRTGDGEITVDEIIQAVNNALNGCSPEATASPTLSPTAFFSPTATLTATPTPVEGISAATRSVGNLLGVTTVTRAIFTLFGTILGHFPDAGSEEGGAGFEQTVQCVAGGNVTLACETPSSPVPAAPIFHLIFSDCVDINNGGVFLSYNGSMTLEGTVGDSCATVPTQALLRIDSFDLRVESDHGTATTHVSDFEAQLDLACNSQPCMCRYDQIELEFAGATTVSFFDLERTLVTSTSARFPGGSLLSIEVPQYNEVCEWMQFTGTLTADVALSTDGFSTAVEFSQFTQVYDASSGDDLVSVSGQIASPCLGGAYLYGQRMPMRINHGAACPIEGEIEVDAGLGDRPDLVRYAEVGIDIDLADDGSIDQSLPSCFDRKAFLCPM